MRLLIINYTKVDIDEKTAIGVDLQSYDVKNPGENFINVSNTFSIPATINNLDVFGLANNVQSLSIKVYEASICDYWVGNEKLIDNAKIRVESIDERINLFIFEKQDFWQNIKKDAWPDFVDEMLTWLGAEKSLPVQSSPFTGNASSFLAPYIVATEGVILPMYLSNLAAYESKGVRNIETLQILSNASALTILTFTATSSAIVGSPVEIIIGFSSGTIAQDIATGLVAEINKNAAITDVYDVYSVGITITFRSKTGLFDPEFNAGYTAIGVTDNPTSTNIQSGVELNKGNFVEYYDDLLDQSQIFLKIQTYDESAIGGHFCIFAKTIFEFIEYKYSVNLLTSGGVLNGNIWDDVVAKKLFIPIRDLDVNISSGNMYFQITRDVPFLPFANQLDKSGKKVYDFVLAFMQHLNILKDELWVAGERVIRFSRFDDLENIANVTEFGSNISGTPKFKPRIESYAQNNYIKFKEIYPDGDEFLNSKNVTCQNVNIDETQDLFTIDAYVPSVVDFGGYEFSYMADKESFKTFTFMISDTSTTNDVIIRYYQNDGTFNSIYLESKMQIAELYSLASEYNFLEEIVTYPKVYEIKKWLSIADIRNLEFFKQYYIRELNGSFFLNKISGFNPEKSKQPTTLELIKVSNRTPVIPPDLDFWTDGVNDPFVDGEGDYWN